MKSSKNKTIFSLIAIFLMLTIAVPMTLLPTANAVDITVPTLVYVTTSRSTVGVGQGIGLVMWTNNVPLDIGEGEGRVSSPSGRQGWRQGIYMVVTKPDGANETFTIPESDPIGGGFVFYTPDKIGTYYLQGFFPATWKNMTDAPFNNYYYTAGESDVLQFMVTEEQVQPWVESPLPLGYFTRPVSEAAREWYPLLSDHLKGAGDDYPRGSDGGNTLLYDYSKGAESAHVLWTKPFFSGGIMSADYSDYGYQTSHYQGLSTFSPIIIEGKIYMQYRTTAHTDEGYLVVDLYTGETLRYVNDTMPSFGQVYKYDSGNQHGGFAYVWKTSAVASQVPERVYYASTYQVVNRTATPMALGTVWEMIDAHTGNHVTYVANVSDSGNQVYGKDGSILYYSTANLGNSSAPKYYLRIWNSSNVQTFYGGLGSAGTIRWQWRPMGGGGGGSNANNPAADLPTRNDIIHDGSNAWSLNASIPDITGYSIRVVREGEYIILIDQGQNDDRGAVEPDKLMALSLVRGQEGTLLWKSEITRPKSLLLGSSSSLLDPNARPTNPSVSLTDIYPEDGVVCYEDANRLMRWGFDMKTGQQLWQSDPEPSLNYYSMADNYYDGKLLTTGFGGVLLAYNIKTGEIEWNVTRTTIGFESPYGNYPINIFGIADGKIYTLTGEHSITQPMWRGYTLQCINASNGEIIWDMMQMNADGGASLGGIVIFMAESKIVGLNYFDNEIYCIGAGNSATTVTASPETPTLGNKVMIKGTVTDATPTGRRNTNDILDWTLEGTPAISDESMGRWMEYKFQQQIFPADATGVEVSLDAWDPNGNFAHIGTVTSEVTGDYGLAFKPEVFGTYKIIATFAGSKAYGPSFAQTFIDVSDAPAATPTATPTAASMTDTYVLGIGAAAIIAIIVIGIILILMLRKRP